MTLTFEQLPFVYQIETLILTEWWSNAGVRTSYQQVEDAMKQEAVTLWQTGTYERSNITMHLVPSADSTRRGDISLNRLSTYRRTSRFENDGMNKAYRGGIPLINGIYQKQIDKNQQLQQQLQAHQNCAAEINSLNQQLVQANNTNSQLQSQLTTAQLQNTQLQNDKNTLQQQNQSLNSQLEQTKKEKEQLEKQIQEKDQEIAKLNQQLQEHQQCQTEREKLQQQITQLQQEKKELQEKNQQLQAENNDLWSQLTGAAPMQACQLQPTGRNN